MRPFTRRAILLVPVVALSLLLVLPQGLPAQTATGGAPAASAAAPEPVDPHKDSSEMNHHIAGFGLVALGLLVMAGLTERFRRMNLAWPALFIAMGLFLVVWSDPEIWPRGELGLNWLLFHDPSARMHKAWAILLIVLGAVEYERAREKLGRFWQVWAFPLIALLGASLLLFHQHKPPVAAAAGPPQAQAQHHHMHPGMQMPADQGASSAPATPAAASSVPATSAGHEGHVMSPTMERVELQHLWFAIVGAAVALFKFLSDGAFLRRRFVPYLWPGCVVVLGVLLVLYRE